MLAVTGWPIRSVIASATCSQDFGQSLMVAATILRTFSSSANWPSLRVRGKAGFAGLTVSRTTY